MVVGFVFDVVFDYPIAAPQSLCMIDDVVVCVVSWCVSCCAVRIASTSTTSMIYDVVGVFFDGVFHGLHPAPQSAWNMMRLLALLDGFMFVLGLGCPQLHNPQIFVLLKALLLPAHQSPINGGCGFSADVLDIDFFLSASNFSIFNLVEWGKKVNCPIFC